MISSVTKWLRNKIDLVAPTFILLVSSVTHFIFFLKPNTIVFDEVYFISFAGNYSLGTYFFDTHPPLGKLIFFWFTNILGVHPNSVVGNIGESIDPSVLLLRIVPMVAGIILPLVVYYMCRNLKLSVIASALAGLLMCLENSLIVHSRFVLMDSTLILFGFISLLLYVIYRNKVGNASDKNSLRANWTIFYLIGSAIFIALATSVKWTGLFFIFPIIIFEIERAISNHSDLPKRSKSIAKSAFIYGTSILVIYMGFFAIHFSLLRHSGAGNDFMSPEFLSTLNDTPQHSDPSIIPEKFFGKFFELNGRMFDANNSLTTKHPYSSKFYTWPFMARPIFYWEDPSTKLDRSGGHSRIYLMGNPTIYWLGTISVVLLLVYLVIEWLKGNLSSVPRKRSLVFILIAFLSNFLPFILIGRVMFLYHYEAALIISIVAIAYYIDLINKKTIKIMVTASIIILSLASFLYFSPLTYGTKMSEQGYNSRAWFSSWK